MAKRGRPTATERTQRMDRILDAAVALFADGGFEATSLDEVAARAEVTKRTLYGDVGDKAALFSAAVDREQNRIRTRASEAASLAEVAVELVFVLLSDSAVALHRSVIAVAPRFTELAAGFYETGPQHSIGLLASAMPAADPSRATALYSLLLGEPHRRRLLGLDPAPTRATADAHAARALALLGL